MKRLAAAALLLTFFLAPHSAARAESWVFARSYYSHNPVQPVVIGGRPPRGPYYSSPQGEYYRSGRRYLNSSIIIRGQTFDNLRIYDGWVQFGGQF